jgi:hypothetical protein
MATILDQHGQPIVQEIASIKRDINRVFYGGVLQTNDDDTLKSRGGGKGLKIYDELKRDAHAGAVLAKRKLAVTSRPWTVEPASDSSTDKLAAELVEKALKHLRFNHLCKRLLEATLKGYAVGEVMWEVRDGYVLPARVMARDARRFVFGTDDELRLLTRENMVIGEAMPDRKFIVHRRGADDDSPYGTGLGGMLFWPVFFKRNGITFWLTFADKFGSPTALGKYPNGSGKPEQARLLQALAAISQDAGVIVPDGMVIELLEASRTGSVDTYEKLVRYMDEQISKAVLGETMSTTAASTGLGSNQAGVQNDVRLEVAKDDGDELDETLNDSLVRWIVEFNMPGAGLPRVQHGFDEPEDLAKRATRDKTITEMGWEPTEAYMLETYGEGWVKKAPAPMPQPFGPGAPGAAAAGPAAGQPMGDTADDPADPEADPAFAEGAPLGKAGAQRAFNKQRQQDITEGAEALAGEWRTLVRKPVEDVLALAEASGGDLVQFRERLTTLLDAKPDPEVVERFAQAAFAAHVMGRGLAPKKTWSQRLAALVQRRKG